jgi:hypothetical protein
LEIAAAKKQRDHYLSNVEKSCVLKHIQERREKVSHALHTSYWFITFVYLLGRLVIGPSSYQNVFVCWFCILKKKSHRSIHHWHLKTSEFCIDDEIEAV